MPQCPRCNSFAFKKAGFSRERKQTYKCLECGYKYVDGLNLSCPLCHSSQTEYLTRNTRKCSLCNSVFNTHSNISIPCKYCGSLNVKKNSYTSSGNPMYYCNSCSRKFVPTKILTAIKLQERTFQEKKNKQLKTIAQEEKQRKKLRREQKRKSTKQSSSYAKTKYELRKERIPLKTYNAIRMYKHMGQSYSAICSSFHISTRTLHEIITGTYYSPN